MGCFYISNRLEVRIFASEDLFKWVRAFLVIVIIMRQLYLALKYLFLNIYLFLSLLLYF